MHKALIQELEGLTAITNKHKIQEIHEFYNKLSRTVRTLTTMKKIDTTQAYVYNLFDKLGPVREVIT